MADQPYEAADAPLDGAFLSDPQARGTAADGADAEPVSERGRGARGAGGASLPHGPSARANPHEQDKAQGQSRDPERRRVPFLLEVSALGGRLLEILVLFVVSILTIQLFIDSIGPEAVQQYLQVSIFGIILFAIVSELSGAYDADARFSLRISSSRLLGSWLGTCVGLLLLAFFLKVSADFSRGWALSWFISGGIALFVTRSLGTLWLLRLKHRGLFNQRVAIYGAGLQGDRLANYIAAHRELTIDIVGFYDERPEARLPPRSSATPLCGTMESLIAQIRVGAVDQVILALPLSAEERLQQIVGQLANFPIRIRLAPDLAGFAFAQRPVALLGGLPVLTLFERPISGLDHVAKRCEDLILGSIILVLSSPLFLLIAGLIKLNSRGPVLFIQEREGFNGKNFPMFKFRSMYVDRLEYDEIRQASRGDPRVTGVGRWLRRLSIDELPQIFNVLRGEMSLVGPRPHARSTRVGQQLFSEAISTYAARHKVKPGMTGWAQVNGWRGQTDTEEKLSKRLECDLYYIENWSIPFDLYILLRTSWAVIFTKSAY